MPDFETEDIDEWTHSLTDHQSDYLMPAEFDDDAHDLATLLEWDDDDTEQEQLEWDEPEPLFQYDDELSRPLYLPDEYDDNVLSIALRIDQWVAGLDATNASQRYLIAELLRTLGYNRLRRWLPWLNKQQWTGEILLLFLRFRVHWESNPHLWEHSFWDRRAHCWYPTRSRYSLSLDDTYALVHRRLDHSPDTIIDETWLGDWLDLTLWQHGFHSFASFAVFRAGFTGSDSWQGHVDWYASDGTGSDESGPMWQDGQCLHRFGPPIWFAEQNWYEPSEWHDNLGW